MAFNISSSSTCMVLGCVNGRDAAVPDPKSPHPMKWEKAVCGSHFAEYQATGTLVFEES
ncbi:hypothetical protein [Rhodococcus sp. SJ]|uniref:hypothetical protein n=1 Tax=Rhodococcus sp. SJ TaxID=3434112 RepID=UPI003D7A5959